MKKLLLLSFLALFLASFKTKAQAPFTTMDSVYINNINAAVLVHGDMWWNPTTQIAHCNFPPNSPKNVNFAGSIWMSGYDASGGLHVAAQTYRQSGNDYWPGPLDASDTLTYATSQNWNKIWKVNRTDIQYFLTLTTHTTSNTPLSILTWPANGNTNAQGYGGVSLSITGDMAPFVDLNGNGIYEPLLGEYPDVPGDQALWWVFSDNGPTHTQSNGKPLGVEVHAMAYAYGRGTLIDNVVYYDYTMVNKSINNYQDVRMAQWDDIDLGWYYDDFIGFDSTWRMGIDYNGTNDDGAGGGHPPNSYGIDPPQAAITMIVQPGDIGTNYVPAGSFMYYGNILGFGFPSIDTQYNNYMRAKTANGVTIANVTTWSPPCAPYGPNANYLYPGDPSDRTQWSECSCNNNPGDRLFILSSNDFTLNAGSSAHFVFALIVADSPGGCPVASFDSIRVVADTAWYIYHNPLSPLFYTGIAGITAANSINIYPNPAHDILYIEDKTNTSNDAAITIYNTLGQVVNAPISKNGKKYELDISILTPGLYNVLYRNGNVPTSKRFVKE